MRLEVGLRRELFYTGWSGGPPEEVTSQLRPEGKRRCSATQDLTEEAACAKALRQERAV